MTRIQRGWRVLTLFGGLASVSACALTPERTSPQGSGSPNESVGRDETADSDGNTFEASGDSIWTTVGAPGTCGVAPKASNPNTQVSYTLVYESASTRWCVDADVWKQSELARALPKFYAYGDRVYARLQSLFGKPTSDKFTFEVSDDPNGAHTGSDFGQGVTVLGGAFTGDGFDGVPGFWGYLLTLHEGINVFTGKVSSGWPSDWWADHRSPFPNSLDAIIMQEMGESGHDSTLTAAANAQRKRYEDPSSGEHDTEVVMFNRLYAEYGGYKAFTDTFALMQADGIDWTRVARKDPDPQLSAYVIAYLQLGIRTSSDLTQSLFTVSGVGSLDEKIEPYTVDPSAVRAIATGHCSIRAAEGSGIDVSAPRAALQRGDYASALASGGKAANCPAECTWDRKAASCVARF